LDHGSGPQQAFECALSSELLLTAAAQGFRVADFLRAIEDLVEREQQQQQPPPADSAQ
jgi:hypothetical protein